MSCALALRDARLTLALGGKPPLWLFMGYMLLTFLGVGFVFGNLNALTMEPLGHIAGIGAAVLGTISTLHRHGDRHRHRLVDRRHGAASDRRLWRLVSAWLS